MAWQLCTFITAYYALVLALKGSREFVRVLRVRPKTMPVSVLLQRSSVFQMLTLPMLQAGSWQASKHRSRWARDD